MIERHPSAVALDEWLRTPEGLKCADGSTRGEYLQNRLWFAFMAGWRAAEIQGAGCNRRAHDGPCHDYPKGIEYPACKECGHPVDFHSVRCRHHEKALP